MVEDRTSLCLWCVVEDQRTSRGTSPACCEDYGAASGLDEMGKPGDVSRSVATPVARR